MANAIANLVQTFQEGTGIPTKLRVKIDSPVPASVCYTLYRVVQEALTNIYKHAQATAVEVELETYSHAVQIEVVDDGCGFHRHGFPKSGFGLKGMQKRIAALGGKLDVATPGSGCRVLIEVPL